MLYTIISYVYVEAWLNTKSDQITAYDSDGWPLNLNRLSTPVYPLMDPRTGYIDRTTEPAKKAAAADKDVANLFVRLNHW